MQQHRNIEVSGATLECTLDGSGTPVVLLANAGCSTGYFGDLACVLAAGGLQTISVNMRGTGESRGSLGDITVHDLAADVAGVLEALECGPAHLVGHAFGNRVARCLAVDRPALVRSVTLLAAGGLIGPATPLGAPFLNTTEVKTNGSDCVTMLGARWLSPASDPKILAQVECWPAVLVAHLATSRGVALEEWWGAGTAPLLAIQGLDDEIAPPGNGHALREQFGKRVRLIDLPRAGHFLLLEQPEAVTRAVAEFVGAGADPRSLPAGDREEPKSAKSNSRSAVAGDLPINGSRREQVCKGECQMRVLVVGAGAIGGYFGGRLLQAGRDVTFLVRPRRADQIRKNGFAVRVAAGGADELDACAIVSEQIEGPYDLVLVCCKAYDLESAMDGFAPAVGPETTILPLLNGLRHLDLLSERFGASRLVGGQCVITATLDERGHAVLLGPTATLTFGELDGTLSRRADAIAATMQGAGFAVQVSNAVLLEMWEKWVLLATFAGMTCLMRGAIGDIVAARAAGLTEALLEDCCRIAASEDQVIRPDVLQRIRALLTQAGSTFMASMLRDIERGTRTEADHVLGDLLHRQSEWAANSPSLLQIAYLHLKTYEARRTREGIASAGA